MSADITTKTIAADIMRHGREHGLRDAAITAFVETNFQATEKALQYLLKTGAISHRLFTNALCAMMGV